MPFDGPTDERPRLLEPSAMDLGDAQATDIGLGLKIKDMPLADQSEADKANTHAFVGAKDLAIACRRQDGRRAAANEVPAAHGVGKVFRVHGGPRIKELVGKSTARRFADGFSRGRKSTTLEEPLQSSAVVPETAFASRRWQME
jgi:hypothetical protein